MQKFKSRILSFCLLAIIPVVFTLGGCGAATQPSATWHLSFSRGMGGLAAQPDTQTFNYRYEISHREKDTFDHVSVKLNIGDNFKNRVIDQSGQLVVGVTGVGPGQAVRLEGIMTLDTRGLTKQQIDALGPVLISADISWMSGGGLRTETQTFK